MESKVLSTGVINLLPTLLVLVASVTKIISPGLPKPIFANVIPGSKGCPSMVTVVSNTGRFSPYFIVALSALITIFLFTIVLKRRIFDIPPSAWLGVTDEVMACMGG